MSTVLAEGQRIEVRGFGSFSSRYLPAGKRRNPATGERIVISGRYVPHFKPGKELRNRVNNGILEGWPVFATNPPKSTLTI